MEIWANTYPSRLESIRKLQKIFENLSILPTDDLNNEAIALFAFKFSQITVDHFQRFFQVK